MIDLVPEASERALFAATFGATFALERRERIAVLGQQLSDQLLREIAHEALTAARGAIQGLRGLGEVEPTP